MMEQVTEYTLHEAAELIGVKPNTLEGRINTGRTKARRVGNGRGRQLFLSAETVEFERQRIAAARAKYGTDRAHVAGQAITISKRRRAAAGGELPLDPERMARQDSYLSAIRAGDVAAMRRIGQAMEHEKEVMSRKER